MLTIHDVLQTSMQQLSEHFTIREKRQVSKMLLMEGLELSETDFLLKKNEIVPTDLVKEINLKIQRINNGEPVQYILGSTFFYDLKLKTDSRALIPRPETEELVDWILNTLKKEYSNLKNLHLLDIGTGSGCIALALKANLPDSNVTGIDLIQDSLDLAKENAQNLNLDVNFELGDALNLQLPTNIKWDIIVSNPPYIPFEDKSKMDKNVTEHEPDTALFVSNKKPIIFYEAIARFAKKQLTENGKLFFEINEAYGEEVKDILIVHGFSKIEVQKDLQGKDRMVLAHL